jgi:hypothetical protein
MAEKLKQDILQPIPRIIGTNETAGDESTARNQLATQKKTSRGQSLGQKKLSPTSSVATLISFGQEYARLTALGQPGAFVEALFTTVLPAHIDERFLRSEDYWPPDYETQLRVFEMKPGFAALADNYLEPPEEPAEPTFELAPWIDEDMHGYTTVNGSHDIDIIAEIIGSYPDYTAEVTEDTVQLISADDISGNIAQAITDNIESTTLGYRSQGTESVVSNHSDTFKVNGITKDSASEPDNYIYNFNIYYEDETGTGGAFTNVHDVSGSEYINSGSEIDDRGSCGGGSALTLHNINYQDAKRFSEYSKEVISGGTTYTIQYDSGNVEHEGFQVRLNGSVIMEKIGAYSTSRQGNISEFIAGTLATGDLIAENAIFYSSNGTAYEYAELTKIWGGGPDEFAAILTFTKTVYGSYTENLDVKYNDRWLDTNIFQIQPNFDIESDHTPDATYTDYIYLVWKSNSRGRTLQFKKLAEFDSSSYSGGISWVNIAFQDWCVTNDFIAIMLPTSYSGFLPPDYSITYNFQYFLIERNPPFRVFTSAEVASPDWWADPDLTVWKRIE